MRLRGLKGLATGDVERAPVRSRSELIRLGQIGLGQIRLGQIWLGETRLGQIRLGRSRGAHFALRRSRRPRPRRRRVGWMRLPALWKSVARSKPLMRGSCWLPPRAPLGLPLPKVGRRCRAAMAQ